MAEGIPFESWLAEAFPGEQFAPGLLAVARDAFETEGPDGAADVIEDYEGPVPGLESQGGASMGGALPAPSAGPAVAPGGAQASKIPPEQVKSLAQARVNESERLPLTPLTTAAGNWLNAKMHPLNKAALARFAAEGERAPAGQPILGLARFALQRQGEEDGTVSLANANRPEVILITLALLEATVTPDDVLHQPLHRLSDLILDALVLVPPAG